MGDLLLWIIGHILRYSGVHTFQCITWDNKLLWWVWCWYMNASVYGGWICDAVLEDLVLAWFRFHSFMSNVTENHYVVPLSIWCLLHWCIYKNEGTFTLQSSTILECASFMTGDSLGTTSHFTLSWIISTIYIMTRSCWRYNHDPLSRFYTYKTHTRRRWQHASFCETRRRAHILYMSWQKLDLINGNVHA